MYLVDIKDAGKTLAPRYVDHKIPCDNAVRVVEGARQLAPHLRNRMIASRFMEHSVFLRELLPQNMKIEIGQLSNNDAILAARFLVKWWETRMLGRWIRQHACVGIGN